MEKPSETSILLVDDEESIRITLTRALRREYQQIDSAEDVALASALLKQKEYDLLIVDKNLPDGSGFDVIARAREHGHQSEIIIITGYSDTESAIQAVVLDVYRYVPKPFNLNHLKVDINNALETRRLKQTLKLRNQELESLNAELNRSLERACDSEQRMRQAERLANIGYLATGIAHEINTPLSMLSMTLPFALKNLELLAETIVGQGDNSAAKSQIDKIKSSLGSTHEAIEFLMRLASDLHSLGQTETLEPIPIKVIEAAGSAMRIARHELKYKAQMVVDADSELTIRGQPSRLVQVFINLLTNAAKAIAGNTPEENTVAIRANAKQNDIVITVSDTGVGIPREHISSIFEPFFTFSRDDQEKGSGIGLALVKEIVDELGGTISVDSQIDTGTAFSLVFPRAETTRAPILFAPAARSELSLARSTYQILFYDSEIANLTAYQNAFGSMHAVYLANTIDDFESILRQQYEALDAVVCELPVEEDDQVTTRLWNCIDRWPDLRNRYIFIGEIGDPLDKMKADGFEVFTRPVRLAILLGAIYNLGPR